MEYRNPFRVYSAEFFWNETPLQSLPAHSSSCGFFLHHTRIGKGAMNNRNRFPMVEWTFSYPSSFIVNRKSRNECRVLLEISQGLSFQHWLGRNSVCCSFSIQRCTTLFHLSRLLTLLHLWQRRHELSSLPFQSVSKLPIKKKGDALKFYWALNRMGGGRNLLRISALSNETTFSLIQLAGLYL